MTENEPDDAEGHRAAGPHLTDEPDDSEGHRWAGPH